MLIKKTTPMTTFRTNHTGRWPCRACRAPGWAPCSVRRGAQGSGGACGHEHHHAGQRQCNARHVAHLGSVCMLRTWAPNTQSGAGTACAKYTVRGRHRVCQIHSQGQAPCVPNTQSGAGTACAKYTVNTVNTVNTVRGRHRLCRRPLPASAHAQVSCRYAHTNTA